MNSYIINKGQKLADIMPEIASNINLAKNFPVSEQLIWKFTHADHPY